MRFLTGKKRISEDGPVKVTCEDILDFAGDAQLGRSDEGQFSPVSSEVVARPKRPLVAASSL